MFAPSFGYQQMLNDGASFMQIYALIWHVERKSAYFIRQKCKNVYQGKGEDTRITGELDTL